MKHISDKEKTCPLNGLECVEGIREDFKNKKKKCAWWAHLYGKDPQTPTSYDEWACAVAWLPVTTIETSQSSRHTTASVDKTANVVNEFKGFAKQVSVGLQQLASAVIKVSENQQKLLDKRDNPSLSLHENGDQD